MIPTELQDYATYIVAYSGGKDSTGMLLWAIEHLPFEKMRVMYNPVGDIDPPENTEYLPYIEHRLKVEIEIVKAGDRPLPPKRGGKPRFGWEQATSFLEMVRLRERWPSWTCRYCTTYLKQWPTVLWAATLPQPCIMLVGQRREESKKRATLPYFSGKKAWKQTRDGMRVYRPILDWTLADVWGSLERHGVAPNPVYQRSSRCNCLFCFQARISEVRTACRVFPDIAHQAAELEHEIEHTWRPRYSIAHLLRQAQAQKPLAGLV